MSEAAPVRPIEDYALIGSTHSAALVHRDGTIAWLCLPRFDSDALFASLLGTEENGQWSLCASDPDATSSRRYRPDTMILETVIATAHGKARILDFMPRPAPDGTAELVRIVEGIEGRVELSTAIRLRFNYGLTIPWVQRKEGAVVAVAGPDAVRLSSSIDLDSLDFATGADFHVEAEERISFTLEWYPSHTEPALPRDPYALLRRTQTEWSGWMEACTIEGPHRDIARRSLITLKAMTYQPSGGIVAAPTTSLPEMPGGVRNWDYRFCWLRDAVLTIYALGASGFQNEASDWRWWLMRAVAGSADRLQIMYGLTGEQRLTETALDHLAGYENSRPVRIGNAAHAQIQLDVYGSVLGAFDGARRGGLPDMDVVWPLECAIANNLLSAWKEKDSGLWEVRGAPQHFVHSKVMCWFAFDRMVASAEDFGLDGAIDDWRAARDEIHAQVCDQGFDAASNSFVQYYGADRVDAALLRIAQLGFLPADDPRVLGTIARIERELLKDGVVYRYLTGDEGDGLPGTEGAFLACSFWLCEAYALTGRLAEANRFFDHLVGFGNDLGLFAEEYDPIACRQLGNFPQAFSHFALVNAVHTMAGVAGSATDHLANRDDAPPP